MNSFALDYNDDKVKIESIISKLIQDRPYREKIKNQALSTASNYTVRSAAMSEIALLSKYHKKHALELFLAKKTVIYYANRDFLLLQALLANFVLLIRQCKQKTDCRISNVQEPVKFIISSADN